MFSPILAFRPARVVERLEPRSAACPLSTRDLVRAAASLRLTLPLVQAPTPGVARAALVAAKQQHAVIGLALPPGAPPGPWFDAVVRAADEVAAGLPIFLAGEVEVLGRREEEVERAVAEAWALADAGLTHLAIDLRGVPAEVRADAMERVAAPALEQGLGLDCLVGRDWAGEAAQVFRELAIRGTVPDVASLRCPAPATPEEVQQQVRELLSLCAATSGTPVIRRGPVSGELLRSLAGSPVAGCDDGGRAAAGVLQRLDGASGGGTAPSRESPLARAEAALDEAERAGLEARTYGEVLDFLERLDATGGATRLVRVLEGLLVEPPP